MKCYDTLLLSHEVQEPPQNPGSRICKQMRLLIAMTRIYSPVVQREHSTIFTSRYRSWKQTSHLSVIHGEGALPSLFPAHLLQRHSDAAGRAYMLFIRVSCHSDPKSITPHPIPSDEAVSRTARLCHGIEANFSFRRG